VSANIVHEIAAHYGLPIMVSRILVNRGFDTMEKADEYLGYTVQAVDPMAILGVPEAIQRIRWAIDNEEQILVYGDYDVDGITGAAIMWSYLHQYDPSGERIRYFVPDRMRDGYGLTVKGINRLASEGFDGLVITVDNGISAHDAVSLANSLGQFDVVITDHHNVPKKGPPDTWVVNPRIGDQYPIMSGAGVAHMVCCALETQKETERGVDWLMDLAAIGTVADMCSLTGINRTIVKFGLEILNESPRLGLWKLISANGRDPEERITTETIGFTIGPCLNAAGRIDNPTKCVELLVTDDDDKAEEIARWLVQVNEERRTKSSDTGNKADEIAEKILKKSPENKVLIVTSKDFHVGVVGLSASNVTQKYDMPALLLTETEDGMLKGSARSVDGFNILEALTGAADLMENFGGHAAAAGMSFKKENLPAIQKVLNEYGKNLVRPDVKVVPFDADVKLSVINRKLVEQLEIFEPCGMGNPSIQFKTSGLMVINSKLVGKKSKDHLSVELAQGGNDIRGIGFFMKDKFPLPTDVPVTAIYKPSLNTFAGRTSVQMMLKDISW
jgi:single-stranded-DNA-specific exonuclease